MRSLVIQRLIGLFLMMFSATLALPSALSWYVQDGELRHFLVFMAGMFIAGSALWAPARQSTGQLRAREGFLVVTAFWTLLGLAGAVPFVLGAHLDFADAAFEAVSAFTTTGATAIIGLDSLPPSILFYRSQLQWFGGVGVVLLALAILPMLGVGGMQLYRAETPGPIKDDKITPRIQQTARFLWRVYLALTGACTLAYWLAGMTLFDALTHAFTTVSTGGFSTHDASMAYFSSPLIEGIAIAFMLAGGINFAAHFAAVRTRSLKRYWADTEVRVFLTVTLALTLLIGLVLWLQGVYANVFEALRYSAFQVVSVITSTGFTTTDFSLWPLLLPVLLIFSSFMGGCAGSTSGGMKTIRFVVLAKQGWRNIFHLVHPAGVRPIKLGGRVVPARVTDAVWGFFSVYVAVFSALMLLVMATGLDHVTAFGAVATCLNNMGPGLGEVAVSFATVNPTAEWFLVAAMLLGRLEIFTLLVVLTPAFWRK